MKKIDFLMAGVGGQGTILGSNILAEVGLRLGYDVKKAEVHGMAQRGGMVESHVRWGEKVYSPTVVEGEVDYLLGFEMLEAARWPSFLHSNAISLVNNYRINPPAVNLGKANYPAKKDLESLFTAGGARLIWIDATEIARNEGNPAAAGVVIMGALSTLLGGEENDWLDVITKLVPPKFVDLNTRAFKKGRSSMSA